MPTHKDDAQIIFLTRYQIPELTPNQGTNYNKELDVIKEIAVNNDFTGELIEKGYIEKLLQKINLFEREKKPSKFKPISYCGKVCDNIKRLLNN